MFKVNNNDNDIVLVVVNLNIFQIFFHCFYRQICLLFHLHMQIHLQNGYTNEEAYSVPLQKIQKSPS